MGNLFGTDGIRGEANQHPITAEMAVRVGKAIASFFRTGEKSQVLIVKDSRISGDMLEAGLAAGICSAGGDAVLCGILPTPGVAWLTVDQSADAGISVSASHNPYGDNGIKLFGADGFKLSMEREARLENLILDESSPVPSSQIGRIHRWENAALRYKDFLVSASPVSLKGIKIVIDCANGATSRIARNLFSDLGAASVVLFDAPNGQNINDGCGSEHPESVQQSVVENRADIGIAFDGDGDRLVAVDERGEALSGDQLLAIFAAAMLREKPSRKMSVVSTVMSNVGLGLALKKMGAKHLMTDVGDRNVVETMRISGAVLGGENSGHLVFLDRHTTGDGMLSALQLLAVMRSTAKPLSELKKVMAVFPQTLMNVPVRRKPDLQSLPDVQLVIKAVTEELGERGRVLVRYSGTEPFCRVMVEGPSRAEIEAHGRRICQAIQVTLG